MKKRKIGDIILWIIIILFLINTLVAYVSYRQVSDESNPSFYLKESKKSNVTTYNIGLYKIVIAEEEKLKNVSLKLFFLD